MRAELSLILVEATMHCALVKKLAIYSDLTDEEIAVLERIIGALAIRRRPCGRHLRR